MASLSYERQQREVDDFCHSFRLRLSLGNAKFLRAVPALRSITPVAAGARTAQRFGRPATEGSALPTLVMVHYANSLVRLHVLVDSICQRSTPGTE